MRVDLAQTEPSIHDSANGFRARLEMIPQYGECFRRQVNAFCPFVFKRNFHNTNWKG